MGIRRIRERSRSSRALKNSADAAVVDLFAISTTSLSKIIKRSNDGFEPCRAAGRFTRPGANGKHGTQGTDSLVAKERHSRAGGVVSDLFAVAIADPA